MSTSRHPLFRTAYIAKKESSYGASIGDGEAGWVSTVFNGDPTIAKPDVQRGEQTGRGHEWNDEIRLINGWDTRVSRSQDLDPQVAGWLMAFGLGSVSTASSGAGYLHTCKPLDISSNAPQLPSTCIVESYPDETLKQKITGLVIDEMTVSGEKGGWLQCSWGGIGNGKLDTATALSIPALTTAIPFQFSGISVATGAASNARNLKSRLRSFSWSWSNNHLADDGYLAGATAWNGGFLRSRCEIGNRKESGVLELVLDANRSAYDELTELLASTEWAVTLTAKGQLIGGSTYHQWSLVMPECLIDESSPGYDGQVKTYTLRLVPQYNAGISAPLKVEVQNDVSAYLTAAA